jgi:integrase
MSRAYKRGGGSHRFGLHRLRHLFGTAAAEGGMHPVISQSIMGHADEKSQRVYQHPSDATIKAEHAKVTPIRALRPARRRRLA